MSKSANTSSSSNSDSVKVRKSHFKENCDPEKGVSLCIPRVFNNIGWRRIKQTFIDLRWGFVERVDVCPMGSFKRAFVHFAPGRWNIQDRTASDALAALCAGDEVKIVYDEPWFWKIGISRAAKPDEAPKPKSRPVVQISAVSTPKQKVVATSKDDKNLTAKNCRVSTAVKRPVHIKVDLGLSREEGEIAE